MRSFESILYVTLALALTAPSSEAAPAMRVEPPASVEQTREPRAATEAELDRYAEREQEREAKPLEKFEGGRGGGAIPVTTVIIVLLVVILVVLIV